MEITRKPPDEAKGFQKMRSISNELINAVLVEGGAGRIIGTSDKSNPVPEPEPQEEPVPEPEPIKEPAPDLYKKAALEADAAVLKFTEGLKNRKKPAEYPTAPAPPGSFDAAAQQILNLIYEIDPTWQERDEMCASEWGLTPAQRVVKYVGMVLDQGLHLNLLQGYEFLEPGTAPNPQNPTQISAMMGTCPQCQKEFKRQVPGQICCSNECGWKYFPKPEPKKPEFDDAFNAWIEQQAMRPQPPADPIHSDRGIPASGVLR